jgi:hypothetical protein
MAITYPLALPTQAGIANVALRAANVVALSQSPFTYRQQVFKHPGERWEATVSLPSMARANAEAWVSFLLALKGQSGTFLLGDPANTAPRGAAANFGTALQGTLTQQDNGALLLENNSKILWEQGAVTSVIVDGANQTGETLKIRGAISNVTGYFLPGDYIQLGAGSTARLHKILFSVNTDSQGKAELIIWPSLRTSPINGSVVQFFNPAGVFRLTSSAQDWQINTARIYTISFDAVEVVT